MATAFNGRFGQLTADLQATPTDPPVLSNVPMMVTWSYDPKQGELDTTSCDSTNREHVADFDDPEFTIQLHSDRDSDLIRACCDGKPRAFKLVEDRRVTALDQTGWEGVGIFKFTSDGGVGKVAGTQLTIRAAGDVDRLNAS